jgi:GTPase involved in cell partitioning and DNA repair
MRRQAMTTDAVAYDQVLNELAVNVAYLSAKVALIANRDDDTSDEEAEEAQEIVTDEIELMVDAVRVMFKKTLDQVRDDLYGKMIQIDVREYMTAIQLKEQGRLN